jgi:hypothetical protein
MVLTPVYVGVKLTTHVHPILGLRMYGAVSPLANLAQSRAQEQLRLYICVSNMWAGLVPFEKYQSVLDYYILLLNSSTQKM